MSTSSLLWSVQPPEGKLSYLFGTMHIKDDRVFQFCNGLYPLILQSDVYLGEMDLGSLQQEINGPAYDMKSFFSAKAYQKIRAQLLKSFKLDTDRYAQLHPLMIMSAISQTVLENDHTVSMDEHLWHFAQEHNLIMQGLESVHEQVALLHSIEPGPLYTQIRKISSRPHALRKFTDKALRYFVQENIHLLYHMTKSSMRGLRRRIIFNRNRLMAQRIAGLDTTQRYFITMGAGHLSGSSGIISSLRKAGYKIKPISFSSSEDVSLTKGK